jgi:hypothetical protein
MTASSAALNFGKEVPILLIGGRYSYQPSAEFLDTVTDMQTITIQLGLMPERLTPCPYSAFRPSWPRSGASLRDGF